jgi:hypothetical protein
MKIEFDILNNGKEIPTCHSVWRRYDLSSRLPVIPCDVDMIWVPDSICCPDSRLWIRSPPPVWFCLSRRWIFFVKEHNSISSFWILLSRWDSVITRISNSSAKCWTKFVLFLILRIRRDRQNQTGGGLLIHNRLSGQQILSRTQIISTSHGMTGSRELRSYLRHTEWQVGISLTFFFHFIYFLDFRFMSDLLQ